MYFDSPKNRAKWERELRGLRAEKERRAREGYEPVKKEAQEVQEKSVFKKSANVRHLTLKQLEAELQEKNGARRVRRPTRQKPLVKSAQKDRVLAGRSL